MRPLRILRRLPLAKPLESGFWRLRARWAGRDYRRETGLRLHLGCGGVRLEGFVNVDRSPEARADLFLDIRRLRQAFAPETVTEVVMIHSLAYLNLWEARDLFRSLYDLCAPGARLAFETPDAAKCATKLLEASKAGELTLDYLEGVRGLYAFGPEHLDGRLAYTPYAFGWTGWHLKQELEDAGFTDARVLEPRTHAPWRDVRVEAMKASDKRDGTEARTG